LKQELFASTKTLVDFKTLPLSFDFRRRKSREEKGDRFILFSFSTPDERKVLKKASETIK